MRITGGMLGGRRIEAPAEGIRPTQEKVREALFSILADRIAGSRFLDLFGGSGAVGIEAWSRGAEEVCWVESSRPALKLLKKNVQLLCPERARVYGADVERFLAGGKESSFDVIFADPPYRKGQVGRPWLEELPLAVSEAGMLNEDGILVIECAADDCLTSADGWEMLKERTYGDSKMLLLIQNDKGKTVSK